jgi:predicted ferric reductase
MITTLTLFIAIILLSWGGALAATGTGTPSIAWGIHDQALYLSGLLGITLMSLAMVLATRPAWLEGPLGGMDRVYRTHKWSAILAVGFASLHWLIEEADDVVKALVGKSGRVSEVESVGLMHSLRDTGEELAEFAIYLVIAMLILALWKRFPYKFWRHIHRALPALYLLLVFHAAVLAPGSYWSQPIGIILAMTLCAGSIAAGLSLTGRIGRSRQVTGKVVSVSCPTPDITEVVCQLEGAWRGHRAGQFAFVRFDRFEGAHPFTIANADQGDHRLRFAIKALGDFTRGLSARVHVGQNVMVEGPYGRFDFDRRDNRARQIWIAGGIGITPFIAWLEALQSRSDEPPMVDLHYSTRGAERDPVVARLQHLSTALPHITLHIHDAGTPDGRLTAEQLTAAHDGARRAEVWFCGPRGFGEQLRAGLARVWGRRLRFHQELFELR